MGFGIKCWEDGWIDTSETVKTTRAPVVLIKDSASVFSKIIFSGVRMRQWILDS